MRDNFLKLNNKPFFDGYVPLKPITYCVVIVYDNNHSKEIYGIENPWAYINQLKKNPQIKNCFIKNENNS